MAFAQNLTTTRVFDAFKASKLEVGKIIDMGPKDYGYAPVVGEEAKRFLIPSLGKDAGGRVFVVNNSNERARLRDYYVNLGKQSAAFYSWVFEKGNVVVQINGNLSKEKANKYKLVLEALK
jgi:hypothetical protein